MLTKVLLTNVLSNQAELRAKAARLLARELTKADEAAVLKNLGLENWRQQRHQLDLAEALAEYFALLDQKQALTQQLQTQTTKLNLRQEIEQASQALNAIAGNANSTNADLIVSCQQIHAANPISQNYDVAELTRAVDDVQQQLADINAKLNDVPASQAAFRARYHACLAKQPVMTGLKIDAASRRHFFNGQIEPELKAYCAIKEWHYRHDAGAAVAYIDKGQSKSAPIVVSDDGLTIAPAATAEDCRELAELAVALLATAEPSERYECVVFGQTAEQIQALAEPLLAQRFTVLVQESYGQGSRELIYASWLKQGSAVPPSPRSGATMATLPANDACRLPATQDLLPALDLNSLVLT